MFRALQTGLVSQYALVLAVGMLASFVVGLGAIHALMAIVRQNVFHRFGWYNLLAAAAFAVYLWVRA